MFAEHLTQVSQRIHQACERSHRDPSSVTLVCVTKGVPVDVIREAVSLGVRELGENRVQEARLKHSSLVTRHSSLKWHLIGHLQRNKAKLAVELFDVIHSVDSVALAEALEQQAAKQDRRIEIFVQVNVSGETTKFGCQPAQTIALARTIAPLPHLRLKGLMTMAPFGDDPEAARPHFRRLRELRDALQRELSTGPLSHFATGPLQLSMGMSQDFEVAIEEGADLVRIGTAIFKRT